MSNDNILDGGDTLIDTNTHTPLATGVLSTSINYSGTWPRIYSQKYLIIQVTTLDDGNPYNNTNASSIITVYEGVVANPTFNIASGSYNASKSVTISMTTPGASIRYTDDGSNPTSTTGSIYGSPVTVTSPATVLSKSTTLKAIVYRANWMDSSVSENNYTLTIKKICFNTNKERNDEIYIMNDDLTGLTRLTNDPNNNQICVISKDGQYIYSTRLGSSYYDIYRMNLDGTDMTNITNSGSSSENFASISPDGSKIVFEEQVGIYHEIYIMNSDGSGRWNPTGDLINATKYQPSFSPDGTKIYYSSDRMGSTEIFRMNIDGSNVEQITFFNATTHAPNHGQ